MRAGRQLALDLALRPALGRDDFLVAPSNAGAVAMIDQWPAWPAPVALIAGPPSSGKSHLVEVWRQTSGAARMDARSLSVAAVPDVMAGGALAVEDVAAGYYDEAALFHLINQVRAVKGSLLLTAEKYPAAWDVTLPDLASRLKAVPVAELGAPDDSLLRGVLVKLFADRQLGLDETVISYLIARMPRSLAAARLLVDEIDRQSLEQKADVTRPFAARVLAGFSAPGMFDDS